jgi:CubicO group peptidase (beta-lactamase class C family)
MMKDRFIFLSLVCFLCISSLPSTFAAELPEISGVPTAAAESVGMSPERLKRIDHVMQGYIDRNEIAGAVTLVARRGKVVHFSALGERDAESGAPMTQDTIFRIASMTKPIASTAMMMLYEEGHFQLRDPISKWLPEFADMQVAVTVEPGERRLGMYKTVPASRAITIQHVLTHTAGLSNLYRGLTQPQFVEMNSQTRPGDTVGDMLQRLAKLPLNFQPGEQWEYGRATDIVGRLVEVMSGQTLDEFLRERLFEPLAMTDTHFYLPESKLDRFSAQYRPDSKGQIELADAPTAASRFVAEPHVYFSGAGGLVSTARDYFRFHQMMLNGGDLDGVRILSRKTIELMTVNHTGDKGIWLTGPGYGFGLGYAVVTDLGLSGTPRSEGSYFWGGAFGTVFWVDPQEELIGILMEQIMPYTHIHTREDMVTMTYQSVVD